MHKVLLMKEQTPKSMKLNESSEIYPHNFDHLILAKTHEKFSEDSLLNKLLIHVQV